MTNEELQKMKDALEIGRDAAHELAWKFHDEYRGYREAEHKQVDADVALLEEAMAIAERATQPARRQSQIDIHRITCEEARKIGGGLIDKIPADDVTALGRAIYQRILDSAPAKDQVAAVRAVPEGWKLVPEQATEAMYHAGQDVPEPRTFGAVYSAMLAAAPSPQPELNGSICPMKTPAIPDEGANEFIELMADWRHAELGSDSTAAFDALVKFIDAWKDAACAAARNDGAIDGRFHQCEIDGKAIENAQAEVVTWKRYAEGVEKRATDAEAKLAAIQSQAAGDVVNIRNKALEDAASRVGDETCGCCWPEEVQDFAGHVAETILAMREQQP